MEQQRHCSSQSSIIQELDNEDLLPNKQMKLMIEQLQQQKQLQRNQSLENYKNLKQQKIKEIKAKHYYNPGLYTRPPFINKPKQKQFFEKQQDVFIGSSGRVGSFERLSSIFPDKVQNPSSFISGLGPNNPGQFGVIPKNKLTKKEIQRIEYWDKSIEERSSNLYQQMIKRQDGRVKKMQLELQQSNIFKPNSFHHDQFGPSDSFISYAPRTPVEVSRLITLQRNHEKHEKWIPNRLIPTLFEKNIYKSNDPYLLRYK